MMDFAGSLAKLQQSDGILRQTHAHYLLTANVKFAASAAMANLSKVAIYMQTQLAQASREAKFSVACATDVG